MLQDRRGMSRASSPFRQNGDSRLAAIGRSGFREQIDGLGWPRASLCIDTGDPRDTTALGTADAAKWVNRHNYCLTQPRATISINIPTGPCGGPAAEAAERRLGAHPHGKFLAGEGGTRRASF